MMNFLSLNRLLEPPEDTFRRVSAPAIESTENDVKPAEPDQETARRRYLQEKVKLNTEESLELVKSTISRGKQQKLHSWIVKGKLEPTEKLGDELAKNEMCIALAISVYLKLGIHDKVVVILAHRGDFNKIVGNAINQPKTIDPDYFFCLLQSSVETKNIIRCHFWEDMCRIEALLIHAFQNINLSGEEFAALLRILIDGRRINVEKLCMLGSSVVDRILSESPIDFIPIPPLCTTAVSLFIRTAHILIYSLPEQAETSTAKAHEEKSCLSVLRVLNRISSIVRPTSVNRISPESYSMSSIILPFLHRTLQLQSESCAIECAFVLRNIMDLLHGYILIADIPLYEEILTKIVDFGFDGKEILTIPVGKTRGPCDKDLLFFGLLLRFRKTPSMIRKIFSLYGQAKRRLEYLCEEICASSIFQTSPILKLLVESSLTLSMLLSSTFSIPDIEASHGWVFVLVQRLIKHFQGQLCIWLEGKKHDSQYTLVLSTSLSLDFLRNIIPSETNPIESISGQIGCALQIINLVLDMAAVKPSFGIISSVLTLISVTFKKCSRSRFMPIEVDEISGFNLKSRLLTNLLFQSYRNTSRPSTSAPESYFVDLPLSSLAFITTTILSTNPFQELLQNINLFIKISKENILRIFDYKEANNIQLLLSNILHKLILLLIVFQLGNAHDLRDVIELDELCDMLSIFIPYLRPVCKEIFEKNRRNKESFQGRTYTVSISSHSGPISVTCKFEEYEIIFECSVCLYCEIIYFLSSNKPKKEDTRYFERSGLHNDRIFSDLMTDFVKISFNRYSRTEIEQSAKLRQLKSMLRAMILYNRSYTKGCVITSEILLYISDALTVFGDRILEDVLDFVPICIPFLSRLSSKQSALGVISWIICGLKSPKASDRVKALCAIIDLDVKEPSLFVNYIVRPEIEHILLNLLRLENVLDDLTFTVLLKASSVYVIKSDVQFEWISTPWSYEPRLYFKRLFDPALIPEILNIVSCRVIRSISSAENWSIIHVCEMASIFRALCIRFGVNFIVPETKQLCLRISSILVEILLNLSDNSRKKSLSIYYDACDNILTKILETLMEFLRIGLFDTNNIGQILPNDSMLIKDPIDLYCFICEFLLCLNSEELQSAVIGSLTIRIISDVLFPVRLESSIPSFVSDEILSRLIQKWGEIFFDFFAKGIVQAMQCGDHSIEIVAHFCRIVGRVSNSNERMKQMLMDLGIEKLVYLCIKIATSDCSDSIYVHKETIICNCCSVIGFLANKPERLNAFYKVGILDSVLAIMEIDLYKKSEPSQDIQISCLRAVRPFSKEFADFIVNSGADKLMCDSANMLSELIVTERLNKKYDAGAVVHMIEDMVTKDSSSEFKNDTTDSDDSCILS